MNGKEYWQFHPLLQKVYLGEPLPIRLIRLEKVLVMPMRTRGYMVEITDVVVELTRRSLSFGLCMLRISNGVALRYVSYIIFSYRKRRFHWVFE